ncbi:cerebellin 11 [Neolamprologus brichardi]|uniref:cerebellin 11 n=1 Tax=Neolamprologus brichardi TaxID=32507 RepID=UPI001643A46F|nr:cerebellin 11 [Neolamprologus brichardi]
MERVTVIILICLLAGLSECEEGGDQNQINQNLITELSYEDTKAENNNDVSADPGSETPATRTANKTTDHLCEPNIYMVLKELGALEERQKATVRALEETNTKLEASEKKVAALNSTLTELRTTYEGQRQVAFSAALPTEATIGPANVLYPLVYRHVLYNVGGHYSPVTGYFTAPVQGVYYFTFSSFWWGGNTGNSGGSLYHNGNPIVSWYGYSRAHPISGSNSAVLMLQVGDMVNVRLWGNRQISDNGNKYCTFTGFLLFPM